MALGTLILLVVVALMWASTGVKHVRRRRRDRTPRVAFVDSRRTRAL